MIHWMRHKNHGVMPAYDTGAVARLEKLGWEVFDRDKERAHAVVTKPADEVGFDRAALAKAYEEKYGKKPHHKLSEEKLKAALSDGE